MNLKRVKRIGLLLLGIFSILMLIMPVTLHTVFGYLAIAVMGIYGVFLMKFWRCPNCDKGLGALWIKHCPHCGEKIF